MGFFSYLFGRNTAPSQNVPLFNKDDPNEAYKLTRYLSWLAANVHSFSSIYIILQDAASNGSGVPCVTISANLDDWHSNNYTPNYETFVKLGLSQEAARYLESVPFAVTGDLLMFTFQNISIRPSQMHDDLMNELKRGLSMSKFIQAGVCEVRIDDYKRTINCRID